MEFNAEKISESLSEAIEAVDSSHKLTKSLIEKERRETPKLLMDDICLKLGRAADHLKFLENHLDLEETSDRWKS